MCATTEMSVYVPLGVFDDGLAVFFLLRGNGDRISGTFQDSTSESFLQDADFKRDNERLPVSSEAATSYTGEHVFRRTARMDGIIVVSETLNRDWATAPPRVGDMVASFSYADNYCSFAALTLHNKSTNDGANCQCAASLARVPMVPS